MRATLNIPDELIASVQSITGLKSKTDAIITAMTDYLKLRRREELRNLRGKVDIEYDWRAEEAAELSVQEKREKIYGK